MISWRLKKGWRLFLIKIFAILYLVFFIVTLMTTPTISYFTDNESVSVNFTMNTFFADINSQQEKENEGSSKTVKSDTINKPLTDDNEIEEEMGHDTTIGAE